MINKEQFLDNYNNIKAWCITCGTDDYVWGCIRFAQRMKWLKSKYSTIVVCPETLNKETFDLLKINNINYRVVTDERLYKLSSKIQALDTLTAYTAYSVLNLLLPLGINENILLYVIDGDKLPIVNLDYYFEQSINKDIIFGIYDYNNTVSGKKYLYLGEYFCRPDNNLFSNLLDFILNIDILQSEIILTKYLADNNLLNIVQIINDYFEKEQLKICHFQGLLKPWNPILPATYELFTQYSYEKFNNFIDSSKEFIQYLANFILITNRLFVNSAADMHAIDSKILSKIEDLYHSLEQHTLL